MKKYLIRLWKALLGKETLVKCEVVRDIGFSASDLEDLHSTFKVRQHRIGMSLEDHAKMAGEQDVINYLTKKVKSRTINVLR